MSFQKLGTYIIRENCKSNICIFCKNKGTLGQTKEEIAETTYFFAKQRNLGANIKKKSNNIIFPAKQRRPGTDIKTNCKSTTFFCKNKEKLGQT